MAVYSQESTRYCNYSGGVTFVIPPWLSNVNEGTYNWPEQQPCKSGEGSYEMTVWLSALKSCECTYLELLKSGWSPQQARTVLPNSLKTEIYMTANFREWRLIFEQRALGLTGKPHPQMEEIMIPLMNEMKKELPAIFGDLGENV
jgi:thymidylate synthase (FAD)